MAESAWVTRFYAAGLVPWVDGPPSNFIASEACRGRSGRHPFAVVCGAWVLPGRALAGDGTTRSGHRAYGMFPCSLALSVSAVASTGVGAQESVSVTGSETVSAGGVPA